MDERGITEKLCNYFNGPLWKSVKNKQTLSRPEMYSSSARFLYVKPHKCCVTSLFSLINYTVSDCCCTLSPSCGRILHDPQTPQPLSQLCFFFYNYGLLLYCFGSLLPRHWSHLLVLLVQPFFPFSLLVCISFLPLCPSPIPTSHLQPGYIRDLVSSVMCPLGAFKS